VPRRHAEASIRLPCLHHFSKKQTKPTTTLLGGSKRSSASKGILFHTSWYQHYCPYSVSIIHDTVYGYILGSISGDCEDPLAWHNCQWPSQVGRYPRVRVTHLSAAYTVYVALLHTLIEGKVKYVIGILGDKRPGYHCGSIPGTASSSVGPEVEPRVVPWTPVDVSFGMIGNRRWIERRERLFRYLPLEPKAKRGSHGHDSRTARRRFQNVKCHCFREQE